MKNTVSRLSSIQFGLQCPEEQAVLRCTVLVCLRFSCQTSETFLFIKIAGPMNFIILQWGILLKKIPTHANRPEWRRQWKALCRLWSWSMASYAWQGISKSSVLTSEACFSCTNIPGKNPVPPVTALYCTINIFTLHSWHCLQIPLMPMQKPKVGLSRSAWKQTPADKKSC